MFRNTSFLTRLVSIVTICSVTYSGTATGFHSAATALQEAWRTAHPSSARALHREAAGPVFKGTNPKRDPKTRGGMWSKAALADAEASKTTSELYASLEEVGFLPPGHILIGSAEPGPSHEWGRAPMAVSTPPTATS